MFNFSTNVRDEISDNLFSLCKSVGRLNSRARAFRNPGFSSLECYWLNNSHKDTFVEIMDFLCNETRFSESELFAHRDIFALQLAYLEFYLVKFIVVKVGHIVGEMCNYTSQSFLSIKSFEFLFYFLGKGLHFLVDQVEFLLNI